MNDMAMTCIDQWQHISHKGSQSRGVNRHISGKSNVEQPPMIGNSQLKLAMGYGIYDVTCA